VAAGILLNKDLFIKEGIRQKCFMHPDDENLCIKIAKPNIDKKRLINETKYWARYSKKKIKSNDYPFFPRYYGTIETNLGIGHVFDLIRDETTDEYSKTLDYYLLNSVDFINDGILEATFKKLIQLMARYRVIANDIKPENICCKILSDNTVQLVLIDGVGHRDFIPLVDWSAFFAKKKIQRRLLKLNLHDLNIQRNYLLKESKLQFRAARVKNA